MLSVPRKKNSRAFPFKARSLFQSFRCPIALLRLDIIIVFLSLPFTPQHFVGYTHINVSRQAQCPASIAASLTTDEEKVTKMKALVLKPATKEVSVRELPIPEPSNGEVLIRVHAVALNPVDANYVLHPLAEQEQRIIGTDFAGIVTAVGPDLGSSSDLRAKVGARVAGFHQGGKPSLQ